MKYLYDDVNILKINFKDVYLKTFCKARHPLDWIVVVVVDFAIGVDLPFNIIWLQVFFVSFVPIYGWSNWM